MIVALLWAVATHLILARLSMNSTFDFNYQFANSCPQKGAGKLPDF